MKILVCGDRHWKDEEFIHKTLDMIHTSSGPITAMVEGGCRGADQLAGNWADKKGIPLFVCPANWKFYGDNAGPIRNKWMVEFFQPWSVLAFHDDIEKSRGTKGMLYIAKQRNIPTNVYHH